MFAEIASYTARQLRVTPIAEAQVDTGALLLDLDNIDSEKIRKLLRKPAD